MCLQIKNFKNREEARAFFKKPLIAKGDIIVYKALDFSGRSPYNRLLYEKGNHYYRDGKAFTHDIIYDTLCINKGLHSCKTRSAARIHGKCVHKMIIPKGSKYFKNDTEYVSDNLIWY